MAIMRLCRTYLAAITRWKVIVLIATIILLLGVTVLYMDAGRAAVNPSDRAAVDPPDRAAVNPPDRAEVNPPDRAAVNPPDRAAVNSSDRAAVNPLDRAEVNPQHRAAFTSEPWRSRQVTLQRGCASGLDDYQITSKQVKPRFYVSTRAGFSVCKVPKAGSSFWARVFLTLQQQRSPERAFFMTRKVVHSKENGYELSRPPINSSLSVLMSRDPYTRLYSGFIDKIFLAGWKMKKRKDDPTLMYVVKNLVCGFNITFANFLDIITTKALKGKNINPHWSPVYLMCNACNISYQAVSHTETLTGDAEYIVDQLQVSDSERDQLFLRQELNTTLRVLLSDLLAARPNKSPEKNCPDRLAYLYKLWQSLQIQGYLHTQSTFPWGFFENKDNFEERSIVNLILDNMARHPLSNQERKLQRHAALVSAYKTIGTATIRRIQQVFMMDFRLFGYDVNPPS